MLRLRQHLLADNKMADSLDRMKVTQKHPLTVLLVESGTGKLFRLYNASDEYNDAHATGPDSSVTSVLVTREFTPHAIWTMHRILPAHSSVVLRDLGQIKLRSTRDVLSQHSCSRSLLNEAIVRLHTRWCQPHLDWKAFHWPCEGRRGWWREGSCSWC